MLYLYIYIYILTIIIIYIYIYYTISLYIYIYILYKTCAYIVSVEKHIAHPQCTFQKSGEATALLQTSEWPNGPSSDQMIQDLTTKTQKNNPQHVSVFKWEGWHPINMKWLILMVIIWLMVLNIWSYMVRKWEGLFMVNICLLYG